LEYPILLNPKSGALNDVARLQQRNVARYCEIGVRLAYNSIEGMEDAEFEYRHAISFKDPRTFSYNLFYPRDVIER
jgi:hypothetical protein